jgi:hypothetical protein
MSDKPMTSVTGPERRFSVHLARYLALGATLLAIALPASYSLAQAQPAGSIRGSGLAVYGPVSLHAGLMVLHARHNGTANFVVTLLQPGPQTPNPVAADPDALSNNAVYTEGMINAIGTYNGASALIVPTDGAYYLQVNAANGPYELTPEQPSPTTANVVSQHSFTGKGQAVSPIFTLSAGSYTLGLTGRGDDCCERVSLYYIDDLGGGLVTMADSYAGRLIDMSYPGLSSVRVDIAQDGLYMLFMDDVDGNWTVALQ